MPIFTQIMIGMRRITTRISVLIFMLAIATTNIKAQEIVFEKADSIFIEEIINRHNAQSYSTTGEKAVAIASEFIGKDYVAGTLDEHNTEPLFISCSKLDCTTFVETVLAAALCSNDDAFTQFCKNLELIRYRAGKRGDYTTRLHYISWWIDDPAKQHIAKDITTNHHTATQVLNLNFMSTHPGSYKHLKENPTATEAIAELERTFNNKEIKYIPKENIDKVKKEDIKDGDIIAIVTAIDGLDVSHIGFACWQQDTLHMIHASSAAGKVINDPTNLEAYLAKRKSHLGIRVFRAL